MEDKVILDHTTFTIHSNEKYTALLTIQYIHFQTRISFLKSIVFIFNRKTRLKKVKLSNWIRQKSIACHKMQFLLCVKGLVWSELLLRIVFSADTQLLSVHLLHRLPVLLSG